MDGSSNETGRSSVISPYPPRYLHHSQSSSLHFSVTTQYCQAYERVSIGLTVSRKMSNEFSHQW